MRASLVIALLLATSAGWSQETGLQAGVAATPDQLIANCSQSADSDIFGLPELEVVCPGLEHALVELGYATFMSEGQLDTLSVHSLVDLQRLADRYREPPAQSDAVSVDTLGPILKSLQLEQQQTQRPPSLFERFRKWLRSLFDRPEGETDSWLSRWLEDFQMSEAVSRAIFYSLVVLVIVLAIVVVINELRAAGVLRRDKRAGSAAVPGDEHRPHPVAMTLADLESVPPGERPSLLLRILVSTLVKTGRLRTEKSLTHRELSLRAAFDEASQRESFQQIAVLGERLLYGSDRGNDGGGGRVSPEEIAAAVQAGRALNTQLASPRPAA